MRTIALSLYITAFAGTTLSSWLNGDVRGAWFERPLDAVLSSVTIAGLIFYALRVASPQLIGAWKFVAPLILAGHIVQAALEVPRLFRPGQEIFVALVALFIIPAIV